MRYQLNRYGNTRFEIVDTEWRPCARCIAILFAMPISEAEAIVAKMNEAA